MTMEKLKLYHDIYFKGEQEDFMRRLSVVLFVIVILLPYFADASTWDQTSSSDPSSFLSAMGAGPNQETILTGIPAGNAAATRFSKLFSPLGVRGAQIIKPGKWLVAYTYRHMAKDGNLIGTGSVSTDQLLKTYPLVSESMDADIHGICLRRGISKNLTLMAMIPYIHKDCTMVMRNGTRFTAKSEGIGDLHLVGSYSLFRSAAHQVVFYGGVSAPTGSINVRDNTPTMANAKLGYGMQLGSGTVDLYPAMIYMGKHEKIYWGAEVSGVLRLGENYNNYRWGNRYGLTGWTGYRLFKSLIGSFRLDWQSWANISGADSELDPKTTPGKDPKLRGGNRLDALAGLSCLLNERRFKGHRLFVEGGIPIYQDLNGPQGDTDWLLSAGWKFIF